MEEAAARALNISYHGSELRYRLYAKVLARKALWKPLRLSPTGRLREDPTPSALRMQDATTKWRFERLPMARVSLGRPVHKLERTVRYLGIEVDDALEIARACNWPRASALANYRVWSRWSILCNCPTHTTLIGGCRGFVLGSTQPAKRAAAEPRATRHGKVGGGDSRGVAATGSTSNVSENCQHSRPIVA
jgi:hypothetical protein